MQDIISRLPDFLPDQLPSQGSLVDVPAYQVLLKAKQIQYSGRIVFERANRVKHVFLADGHVVGLHSNLVPEGVDMLLGQGFLFSSQIADLFAKIDLPSPTSSDWEAQFLDTLRKKRILQESEIQLLLRLQLEERILNLLGWFEGKFRLHAGDTPPTNLKLEETFKLSQLFEQVKRLFTDQDFSLHLASPHLIDRRGEMHSTGGARIIFSYAAARASGTVLLERGQRKKLLHYKSGVLSSVVSTNPSETLAGILTRFAFLSPDMVSRLESTAHARQTRLPELLIKEQILTSDQVEFASNALHFERVLEALSWRSGRFEFKGSAEHISEIHTDETTERFTVPPQSAPEKTAQILEHIMEEAKTPILLLHPAFSWTPRLPNLVSDVVKLWNHSKEKALFISPQASDQAAHLFLPPEDPRWGVSDFWHGLREEYQKVLVFVPDLEKTALPQVWQNPMVVLVAQSQSSPPDLAGILQMNPDTPSPDVKGFLWLTKEFLHLE